MPPSQKNARKNIQALKETDLYLPVKSVLESQGYTVKSEIGKADVVACRGEEAPIIVELKTGFSLTLFHQAVDRLSLSDSVYVAVPQKSGKLAAKALRRNLALCRVLGLGVMTVRLRDGHVQIHRDPLPTKVPKSKKKTAKLLKEFAQREGDPNLGGSTKITVMTAYRQDAVKCLLYLYDREPIKASVVAKETDVPRARTIMAHNHYGWFTRDRPGYYTLSDSGRANAVDLSNPPECVPPKSN